MINVTLPQSSLSSIARQGRRVLLIALFVSVFIHLFSYVNLDYFARQNFLGNLAQHSQPVRFNIVDSKSKLDPELPDAQQKKMAEVIQAPTVRPNDARYSSFQDHQTERETRIDVRDSEAGKKAGPKGHSDKAQIEQRKVDLEAKPKLEISNQQSGSLEFMYNNKERHEKRERYQKLLPKQQHLAGLVDAGYKQYLDEKIELGDSIDINTSEYRFMGYFSMMRRAIELVWIYPMEAVRRGMQGEVGVEFVIHKDGTIGRIQIYKSSGFKVLDDAIVEAVSLASPFSPLPNGFGKDNMRITGSFRYILGPYASGAH